MKKKLIIPLTVIIVIAIIMFLYEEGTHHLIKPSSTNILIETSYQSNQTKEYKGTLIYENGSIFTYKDNIKNITKKRWYKIPYSDLKKIKKYINELDGEFEIKKENNNNENSKTIYIYRNNEKIKIYESSDIEGQINSEHLDKILRIINKYN